MLLILLSRRSEGGLLSNWKSREMVKVILVAVMLVFVGAAPGSAEEVCPTEEERALEAVLSYMEARDKYRKILDIPWPDDSTAQERINRQMKKALQDMETTQAALRRANDLFNLCLEHAERRVQALREALLGQSPPSVRDIPPMEPNP